MVLVKIQRSGTFSKDITIQTSFTIKPDLSDWKVFFCWFLNRKCIIDKNAKIGKNVIIMNKGVSFPWISSLCFEMLKKLLQLQRHYYYYYPNVCRMFKKRIGQRKDSTFGLESLWLSRRLQFKMVLLYEWSLELFEMPKQQSSRRFYSLFGGEILNERAWIFECKT